MHFYYFYEIKIHCYWTFSCDLTEMKKMHTDLYFKKHTYIYISTHSQEKVLLFMDMLSNEGTIWAECMTLIFIHICPCKLDVWLKFI